MVMKDLQLVDRARDTLVLKRRQGKEVLVDDWSGLRRTWPMEEVVVARER